MWRIKLVRATEKGMSDCLNGQFCGHVQKGIVCFPLSVFGLCGLWQREYLVGQNSLMYWNKRENENTTLGLIDYLQKQAWFCKISLNKW